MCNKGLLQEGLISCGNYHSTEVEAWFYTGTEPCMKVTSSDSTKRYLCTVQDENLLSTDRHAGKVYIALSIQRPCPYPRRGVSWMVHAWRSPSERPKGKEGATLLQSLCKAQAEASEVRLISAQTPTPPKKSGGGVGQPELGRSRQG